jgi:hypothetical protein
LTSLTLDNNALYVSIGDNTNNTNTKRIYNQLENNAMGNLPLRGGTAESNTATITATQEGRQCKITIINLITRSANI